MFLSQKHGFSIYMSVFWHVYPNRCDGLGGIKHFSDAHTDILLSYNALQLLIYFISYEADTDMGFDSPFCEVKNSLRHPECRVKYLIFNVRYMTAQKSDEVRTMPIPRLAV